MHQVLLVISAITPVSAIAYSFICSFLLYQSLIEYTDPFSLVFLLGRIFLSASHIRPFYLRSYYISNSSKLHLSAHRISYQVALSSDNTRLGVFLSANY